MTELNQCEPRKIRVLGKNITRYPAVLFVCLFICFFFVSLALKLLSYNYVLVKRYFFISGNTTASVLLTKSSISLIKRKNSQSLGVDSF